MAIITFHSKAAGEVIMFRETAEKIFKLIGKPLHAQGVLTPEEFDDAVAKISAEIEREKELIREYKAQEDLEFKEGPKDPYEDDEPRKEPPVFFTQRAIPFLEMIEFARKDEEPIFWGIP